MGCLELTSLGFEQDISMTKIDTKVTGEKLD